MLLALPAVAGANPMAEGKEIYDTVCIMCHADGKGTEMAPSLIGSSLLQGKPDELIRSILHGRMGVTTPAALMPPADWLTDEQVAAVSEYVRTTFARNPGPVSPTSVARMRSE